jgi:outer membrane receptor protein involved in Fe transport
MDEHIASCPACLETFAEALRFKLEHDPHAATLAMLPRRLRQAMALLAAAAAIMAVLIWRDRTTPVRTPSTSASREPGTSLRVPKFGDGDQVATLAPGPPSRTAAVSSPQPEASIGSAARTAQPLPTVPETVAPPHRPLEPTPDTDHGATVTGAAPSDTQGQVGTRTATSEDAVRRSDEVTVVSASRVEERLVDAPATMSVITSEALAVTPARNVADVIRSVPGLNVIQTSARDFDVTPRQATSTLAGSTLVTVDGRSVYLDSLGVVLWDFVPSPASGEIQQVEVVRGPASVVWGANAVNGVVNFITKTPRQFEGFGVVLGAGLIDRSDGSRAAAGVGRSFDSGFSLAHAFNQAWSYKISGGYFYSDPYSRPVGKIPLDCHPLGSVPCRDADLNTVAGGIPIGGASYPVDAAVPGGFENAGTRQPKLYLRVDQDVSSGGRVTYEGGFGGTEGIVHTGIGPFDLESGSYMGFGRVAYHRDALRLGAFVNLVDARAPNQLTIDPESLGPVVLGFKTQTYDFDFGDARVLGRRHILSYGANYRRNDFDVTIAQGPDRNEFGAYGQWEYFVDKFRLAAGARADRFDNLGRWVWSPRLSVMFKPRPGQSIRASYNKAFTSPSFIDNHLDQSFLFPTPVDLTPLATAVPALAPLIPSPFLLAVTAVGNPNLRQQSTSSYELAYAGNFYGHTTVGLAAYLSRNDDNIGFAYLVPQGTPGFPPPTYYTVQNPARGVTLPTSTAPQTPITLSPLLMEVLAQLPPQFGGPVLLPEMVATYLNLGPIRNTGIEASIDHRFDDRFAFFANYSWQATPKILTADAGQVPYPPQGVGIPPKQRFNLGLGYDGPRLFANANLNYAAKALWVDELSSDYAGFTDAYAMLNAALGVKLASGKVTLSLRSTNITNATIQQHIFGDIFKRSVVLELRLKN